MENVGREEFDEMKHRAAELWPDLARYMESARLEDLRRWNPVTKRWEWVRAVTVLVFERPHDDQTVRAQ